MVMGRWPTLHDENRARARRRDFLSKPPRRSVGVVAEATSGASGRLGAGRDASGDARSSWPAVTRRARKRPRAVDGGRGAGRRASHCLLLRDRGGPRGGGTGVRAGVWRGAAPASGAPRRAGDQRRDRRQQTRHCLSRRRAQHHRPFGASHTRPRSALPDLNRRPRPTRGHRTVCPRAARAPGAPVFIPYRVDARREVGNAHD